MNKYVNILRYILNIIEGDEFDDIIKNIIIDKMLDNYEQNSHFINKFSKKYYRLNKNDDAIKTFMVIRDDTKNQLLKQCYMDINLKKILMK